MPGTYSIHIFEQMKSAHLQCGYKDYPRQELGIQNTAGENATVR